MPGWEKKSVRILERQWCGTKEVRATSCRKRRAQKGATTTVIGRNSKEVGRDWRYWGELQGDFTKRMAMTALRT